VAVVEDIIRHRLELSGLAEYGVKVRAAASALNVLDEHLDSLGKKQLGLGIAAGAGALFLIEGLKKAGEAAGEEEAVFTRASIGFRAHGKSFPREELEAFSAAQEHLTGVSREQIASTAGLLGVYGATKAQAEALVPGILNISAAMKDAGVTTESAARMVGMFLETGKAGRLARLGIIIDPAEVETLGRAGALAAAMQRAAGGAAAEMRNTLPGAITASQSAFHALEVQIGKGVVPILRVVADVTTGAAMALEKIPGAGAAIAAAMGLGAVALGVYSFQTIRAVANTVRLAEAHLAAAAAARVHAAAEGQAAGAVATGGAAAGGAAVTGGAVGLGTIGAAFVAATALLVGEVKLLRGGKSELPPWLKTIPQFALGDQILKFFEGDKKKPEDKPTPHDDRMLTEQEKQTAALQAIRDHTSELVGSRDVENTLGGARVRRELARGLG
jgi:hypothetical protein